MPPMKYAKQPETEPVSFRVPKKVKAQLQRLAVVDGRTFSSYMVKVLTEHVAGRVK